MAAPIIDTQALPATPAHEWASDTAQALKSDSSALGKPTTVNEPRNPSIPYFASTNSTPGPDFPGSFPKEALGRGETPAETKEHAAGLLDMAKSYMPAQQDVTNAFNDAGETAKSYMPAQQDVTKALNDAGETARRYLPAAVTSYFPDVMSGSKDTKPITSLPSTEVHGDTSGKSDGVGSLPGNFNEEAVAKLPEERAADGTISDTTEVGTEKAPIQTTTNNTLASHNQTTAVTAKEPVHHEPTGGVGDLPGTASESGVALLPEERMTKDPLLREPTAGGVGDLPGTASESGVALLPEERATNPSALAVPPASTLSTTAATGHAPTTYESSKVNTTSHAPPVPSKDSEYKPYSTTTNSAAIDPKSTGPAPITAPPVNTGIANASDDMTGHPKSASSTTTGSSGGSSGKSGFMSKIKGEAKIITGKLGRNEHKVEEGRKMMGKD